MTRHRRSCGPGHILLVVGATVTALTGCSGANQAAPQAQMSQDDSAGSGWLVDDNPTAPSEEESPAPSATGPEQDPGSPEPSIRQIPRSTGSPTPSISRGTQQADRSRTLPTRSKTQPQPSTLPRYDPAPKTPVKASTLPTTSTPAPRKPAASKIHDAQESEVLRLVNVERATAGCGPVTADATLAQVARAHSKDMAVNNFFDHNSQDGRSPFDRMRAAGYSFSTAAENIAAGNQSASSVMDSWMKSPGHRENILNCALKELGVGRWERAGSQYGIYWTQDFGTP